MENSEGRGEVIMTKATYRGEAATDDDDCGETRRHFFARQRNPAQRQQHPELSLSRGPTTIPDCHLERENGQWVYGLV